MMMEVVGGKKCSLMRNCDAVCEETVKGGIAVVVFELLGKENGIIKYQYYPENNREKAAGIIEIDIWRETIDVVIPAAEDFSRKGSMSYWYANHAIEKIATAYEKGEILEKGSAIWY